MDFEARLENIFPRLELFRFPENRGNRCFERLWQFGYSVKIVMEICRIVVVCQLRKGQQNLVCSDRRRGFLTAVDW